MLIPDISIIGFISGRFYRVSPILRSWKSSVHIILICQSRLRAVFTSYGAAPALADNCDLVSDRIQCLLAYAGNIEQVIDGPEWPVLVAVVYDRLGFRGTDARQ